MKHRSVTPPPPPEDDAQQQWMRDAVQRYEGSLIQYAAKLLGDVDRARDIVQDAFLKLWTADRAAVNGHLGQWLYRVCRNGALDVCRKENRMTSTSNSDQLEWRPMLKCNQQTQQSACEQSTKVLAALETLPERQQEVIRLKFQGGLSYQEIANVLDITANHVGVLIHNGLKAIRERLATRDVNDHMQSIAGIPGIRGAGVSPSGMDLR